MSKIILNIDEFDFLLNLLLYVKTSGSFNFQNLEVIKIKLSKITIKYSFKKFVYYLIFLFLEWQYIKILKSSIYQLNGLLIQQDTIFIFFKEVINNSLSWECSNPI